MDKRLTVAIIGAGRIAGGYDTDKVPADTGAYTHAGAYRKDGRFDLKTVCDSAPERAERFGRQWGIGRATSNPDDIYNSYHDVVSVCTPDATHYEIISDLIKHGAAKTIFAEKPLATEAGRIRELARLADERGVNLVVNFQRKFDDSHKRLWQLIAERPEGLLSVNCWYIKGLDHIGVTLIDTLTFLCGIPRAVLAYNRVFNKETASYSYEFVLFFDSFNATVKTAESPSGEYHYHIFEIDLLFDDRRVTIKDNSRTMETRRVGGYAYSGVRALDDLHPLIEETGYRQSMVRAVDYLYDITTGRKPHRTNKPEASIMNKAVIDAVVLSYEKGLKIGVEEELWRR